MPKFLSSLVLLCFLSSPVWADPRVYPPAGEVLPRPETGACVMCGVFLVELYETAKRDIRQRRKDDLTFRRFLLSDGSQMSTLFCGVCSVEVKQSDFERVMQAIRDGWEYEITELNGWNEAQQQHYRDRFYSLTIKDFAP